MLRLPFDLFGLIAPFYDRLHQSVAETTLRRLLALEPGMALLDIGGGTGRVARRFQGEVARTVVLDPSWGMLRRNRSYGGANPVRGVAERLPFSDGSFHRVLCVDAFHHFLDQGAAMAEMGRVLAPGGRVVLQEFNVGTWAGKLIRAGEAALFLGSAFRRPWELEVLAAETGLLSSVYNDDAREFYLVLNRRE